MTHAAIQKQKSYLEILLNKNSCVLVQLFIQKQTQLRNNFANHNLINI